MSEAERAGLLAAVRQRPADDFPRQVDADWLDDHGEPERAELMRLQLALARGDGSGRGREQELLEEHGVRWLHDELPPGHCYSFATEGESLRTASRAATLYARYDLIHLPDWERRSFFDQNAAAELLGVSTRRLHRLGLVMRGGDLESVA